MCKGNVSSIAPFTQNYVYSLRFCVKGATPWRHEFLSCCINRKTTMACMEIQIEVLCWNGDGLRAHRFFFNQTRDLPARYVLEPNSAGFQGPVFYIHTIKMSSCISLKLGWCSFFRRRGTTHGLVTWSGTSKPWRRFHDDVNAAWFSTLQ